MLGGWGGAEKRMEVFKLVGEMRPSILCIQETKLQVVDAFVCTS